MSKPRRSASHSGSEAEDPLLEENQRGDTMKVSRFKTIEFLGRLVFGLMMRFWGVCTTAVFILLLIYWFYGGILVFVLLFLAIAGVLYNVQDKLLYYPSQPPTARLYVESPAILSLPFENLAVKTLDGVTINMYLIKQQAEHIGNAVTVIYLHGNAGNIGHRLLNAHMLHTLSGFNILLVEYRGYGKSHGSPSESGLYLDAMAAFDYLLTRPDINVNKICIFGRSLGGAVAIDLASRPDYSAKTMALILENSFTSLPSIAKHLFDIALLDYLPHFCFKNKFLSSQRIRSLKVPTLFLSGLADNLIPPKMMQELYDGCGSGMKRMARFETGTHNETWQCQGYHETINRFMEEVSDRGSRGEASYSVDEPFNDHGVYSI